MLGEVHRGYTHSGLGQISSLKPGTEHRNFNKSQTLASGQKLLTPGPGAQGDPHLRSQPSEPGWWLVHAQAEDNMLLRSAWAMGDLAPKSNKRTKFKHRGSEEGAVHTTGPGEGHAYPKGNSNWLKPGSSFTAKPGRLEISASVKQLSTYKLKEVRWRRPHLPPKVCLTMLDLQQTGEESLAKDVRLQACSY